MSARCTGRVLRTASAACTGGLALVVLAASPAAAHDVGSGSLPAPPWLLSYLGAFAVLAAAVALRAAWPAPRLARLATVRPPADGRPIQLGVGHLVGTVLLALAVLAAVVGPDTSAANIAPVAVLVVWWVGLPLASLVLGDVMRASSPFVTVVRLVERWRGEPDARVAAPTWVPAAFLAAFAWFFVAYHRPGSPRALAVLLVAYALAAVGLGLRWGSRWLATGEGFGALSAAVSSLAPIRRSPVPAGTAPLMLVWVGSTAFDGFTSTPFWADVVGNSMGWERTAFNTVGLVWLTAVAAGLYLGALRLAAASRPDGGEGAAAGFSTGLATALGGALVPLALGWFIAHDLTLLLFEGQNFITLLSDPIGRGWDLVGSISHTADYSIVQARWVAWVQIAAVLVGHLVAVVVAHDLALRRLRQRAALPVTWCMAGASAVSIVGACLLVLG